MEYKEHGQNTAKVAHGPAVTSPTRSPPTCAASFPRRFLSDRSTHLGTDRLCAGRLCALARASMPASKRDLALSVVVVCAGGDTPAPTLARICQPAHACAHVPCDLLCALAGHGHVRRGGPPRLTRARRRAYSRHEASELTNSRLAADGGDWK